MVEQRKFTNVSARTTVLGALLIATFLATAVLSGMAFRMDRARRAAIDKALKNYTGVASAEFADAVTSRVYWSLKDVFQPVAGPESIFSVPDEVQRDAELRTGRPCANRRCDVVAPLRPPLEGGSVAPPASLDRMARTACVIDCAIRGTIRYYFRYDGASRALALQPGAAVTPPAYRAKVAKMIGDALATSVKPDAFVVHRVLELDGEPHVLVYITRRDERGAAIDVYGVAAAASAYAEALVAPLYRDRPLLPVSLVGRAPGDSLYSIVIADSGGRVYYRSAVRYDSPFRERVPIDPSLDPLTVELALRGETAERLVMGGIPGSRGALIGTLFALTTLLLLVLLAQWRAQSRWSSARELFVSSVSHELRTPLAQIVLFGDLLRLDKLHAVEERRRAIDIIVEEARRLAMRVDNLLRFSLGGPVPTPIHPTEHRLAPLIRATIDAFTPLVTASGVELRTALDPPLHATVDPEALRQILFNLLDNAVKYAGDARVVRISTALDGTNALLIVEDGGAGVPEAYRERVWQPFARMPHHALGPIDGAGIGLSVVRDLAVAHGGSVRVEDADGGGARFVVSFPRARQVV